MDGILFLLHTPTVIIIVLKNNFKNFNKKQIYESGYNQFSKISNYFSELMWQEQKKQMLRNDFLLHNE